jgi:hypothetical protein
LSSQLDIFWKKAQASFVQNHWAALAGLADKNYALLKGNARHPSFQLKNVGGFWSVRAVPEPATERWLSR